MYIYLISSVTKTKYIDYSNCGCCIHTYIQILNPENLYI